ncbi:MAG: acetyl esterase [Verrucomicrobiales bacterium]|jgi:acetyl esterase
MDQQARKFLAAAAAAKGPPVPEMTPAEAREMFADLKGVFLSESEEVNVIDIDADGVPCRLYRPADAEGETLPVVLYFHGGGWVVGSVETHDTLCQHLCHHSGAVIISVDYRLAPEAPFPAAAYDCYQALDYVVRNAELLHIDPAKLAVAGDSAGGNLAALICQKVRDARGSSANGAEDPDVPDIAFQALLYPVTDAGCNTPSYNDFAKDHGLTKEEMQYFWACYCGGSQADETKASPLRTNDCSALPPAWILTAEFDVLRDEGEKYAAKLKAAGVNVELERWRGQIHGFVHFAGFFDEGKRAIERAALKLKTALK